MTWQAAMMINAHVLMVSMVMAYHLAQVKVDKNEVKMIIVLIFLF